MTKSIVSLSQIKARAAEMLSEMKTTEHPTIFTQCGVTSAVVHDCRTRERLQNAMPMMELMVQGEADVAGGRTIAQKRVFADLEGALAPSPFGRPVAEPPQPQRRGASRGQRTRWHGAVSTSTCPHRARWLSSPAVNRSLPGVTLAVRSECDLPLAAPIDRGEQRLNSGPCNSHGMGGLVDGIEPQHDFTAESLVRVNETERWLSDIFQDYRRISERLKRLQLARKYGTSID